MRSCREILALVEAYIGQSSTHLQENGTYSMHRAELSRSLLLILSDIDISRDGAQHKYRIVYYSLLTKHYVPTLNTIFQVEGVVTGMDWWGKG